MAVLDRSDLEASSLADLHAIAGQIGLDGFRRLRKADLVELILERAAGGEEMPSAGEPAEKAGARPSRGRAPRGRKAGGEPAGRRPRRGETKPSADAPAAAETAEAARPERAAEKPETESVEGEVEVLGNGSAFLRLTPPGHTEGDVYISAAQVRRCELVSGDRVTGPVRTPRRSERYPSLVRVDTVNGEPADTAVGAPRYESLPARFPGERIELGVEDPTLKAIEWLTPLGLGSRAVIVGAARAGKSETLRRLLAALAGRERPQVTLLLLGVRPEEIGEWQGATQEPAVAHSLAIGIDIRCRAVEQAIEAAKRQAARGADVLVAIDSLDSLHPHVARRALAAARNIDEGGSLTVIGTAAAPFGGESTVIWLDVLRTSTGRLPALDLVRSGTLRAELLVGEEYARDILKERAAAADAEAHSGRPV